MESLEALAEQVVKTLQQNHLHITTVESCTGGGLANWITNISGASEVMSGARVTYCNDEKIRLGVPGQLIEEYSVYSVETAAAMADAGLKSAFKADIAVGITGSITRVDPANDSHSKPGEVYIAVKFIDKRAGHKGKETLKAEKFIFPGPAQRWEVKDKAIAAALEMVLRVIG
jgi:nicotinamide-nucleotide amidase